MALTRRTLMKTALWGSALAGAPTLARAAATKTATSVPFKRIAVEEEFTTFDVLLAQRKLLAQNPQDEPGFTQFWGGMLDGLGVWGMLKEVVGAPGSMGVLRAMELGEGRIAAMDEAGIDIQVLQLTSPGVQVYDTRQAMDLAQSTNERLAEAVRAHPDRLAGLATIAPQDPRAAAEELERAVKTLGLKGGLINSHTKGEYLDEPKFSVIFEKAQELDVPIYIHPRVPAQDMVKPFQKYFGLEAAAFGFPMDASLHALRLILSGVFDDYPKLKIVLGHMGEGLPFWLPRIDKKMAFFGSIQPPKRKLEKAPSQYFLENFHITTSGMNYEAPLKLAHEVMGPDRVMFAVDYPFEENEEAVRVMDGAPISDEDKAKIYQTNAERVFKL